MSDPSSTQPTNTVDPDLEVGQVVGEFVVEAKIGQGGFGTVYRATHPLIGKIVAVKVLARKFSVDPEMVSRFVAEARSVNQIRHRHIIDIFSFGTLEDGRAYYVMEYLEGETLDVRIEREGYLLLPVALPILTAIARALDAAHAKGIAHRDLKPENVFLVSDPDGGVFPKLLDFGIAKLMGSDDGQKHKTRTGIPIGTPYYMSPEQCRGKGVDHRTDYYAFGIVAYEMLTGIHAIDGDDYMAIMMRQLTDEPSAPSTVNAELPPAIDDAIAWMMKKDPSERPPNLITAVRALETVAEESGIMIPRSAPSAAWDIATGPGATPPPGSLRRPTPTPAPRSPTAPAGPGLAATMPSDVEAAPIAAPRSRAPIVVGGIVGAIAVAAVVFFAMSRGGSPPPPPPTTAPPAPPAVAHVPPPVIAPPATVAVDAAEPDRVEITIEGAPTDTDVLVGTTKLGVTPKVMLDRGTVGVDLVLRHGGFVSVTKTVVPDKNQALKVTLHHVATGGTKPPTTDQQHDTHGIEDPFAKRPP